MSEGPRKSIVIVGGGASGVIMAAHLLQRSSLCRVTIVERRAEIGRGRAYSTTLPEHVLNVSAKGMSAYADQPLHYWGWLEARRLVDGADDTVYTPRAVYGDYLEDLVRTLERAHPGSLRIVREEALSITPASSGVEVRLANGASIVANEVVLAAGHEEQPQPAQTLVVRVGSPEDTPVDEAAPILVLGTGLSMVDAFLSLRHKGHRGEIVAISRRGLLPNPHDPGRPLKLDSTDVPLGTDLSYFVRWFRRLVRDTEAHGGNWRDVVDGIRPFNQLIWRNWPIPARRRFLEHTRAWWDIHRHRMPPQLHLQVSGNIAEGRLKLIAGRVVATKGIAGGVEVTIQPRGRAMAQTRTFARVYDCTGLSRDVSESAVPVIRDLVKRGLARPDQLRLGLDVTAQCGVLDADGVPVPHLHAVGPLTRGAFFEIEAVPDIRNQCAALAKLLTP